MDKAERTGSGLKRIGEIMERAVQPYPEIESNLFFRMTFKKPFYNKTWGKIAKKKMAGGRIELPTRGFSALAQHVLKLSKLFLTGWSCWII